MRKINVLAAILGIMMALVIAEQEKVILMNNLYAMVMVAMAIVLLLNNKIQKAE